MAPTIDPLAHAIRDGLDAQFRPSLTAALDKSDRISPADRAKALADAEAGWQQLAVAIATGIVAYFFRDATAPPADPQYVAVSSSKAEDGAFWAWVRAVADATATTAPTSLTAVLTQPAPQRPAAPNGPEA